MLLKVMCFECAYKSLRDLVKAHSDLADLALARDFAFLISSQVMLILLDYWSHFESKKKEEKRKKKKEEGAGP